MSPLEIYVLIATFIGLLFSFFNALSFYFLESKKDREIKEYPKISIIVPAYNEEKNIEETIKSLLNLDYDKNKLEIIIVDDGSTDKTYEIAKKYENKILKVYKKENGGKASALNFGLKYVTGEYVAILDADTVVPKDALKKILKYFDDENVMIVVPALQTINKKNFIESIQSIEYSYYNFLRGVLSSLNSIYVAPGTFSIFRKKYFDIVGTFDEKNISEDMDIAIRAHLYNFKVNYCPDVLIKTKVPSRIRDFFRQRIRWYLGFIDNFIKYKGKIANKILVNLVFTSAILFILLPIGNLFLSLYNFINYIYENFKFYYSINFELEPFISRSFQEPNQILTDFSTNLKYISLRNSFLIFYTIIIFAFFYIFLKISWNIEKENHGYKKAIFLIIYTFVYFFMYAIIWLLAIYYKLFGRELRWGGIVWKDSLINKLKHGSK